MAVELKPHEHLLSSDFLFKFGQFSLIYRCITSASLRRTLNLIWETPSFR